MRSYPLQPALRRTMLCRLADASRCRPKAIAAVTSISRRLLSVRDTALVETPCSQHLASLALPSATSHARLPPRRRPHLPTPPLRSTRSTRPPRNPSRSASRPRTSALSARPLLSRPRNPSRTRSRAKSLRRNMRHCSSGFSSTQKSSTPSRVSTLVDFFPSSISQANSRRLCRHGSGDAGQDWRRLGCGPEAIHDDDAAARSVRVHFAVRFTREISH